MSNEKLFSELKDEIFNQGNLLNAQENNQANTEKFLKDHIKEQIDNLNDYINTKLVDFHGGTNLTQNVKLNDEDESEKDNKFSSNNLTNNSDDRLIKRILDLEKSFKVFNV